MANTPYLNKVVDARLLVIADKGFSAEEFARLHLGVVVMKEELKNKRDVKWMDGIDMPTRLPELPQMAVGSNFKTRSAAPKRTSPLV